MSPGLPLLPVDGAASLGKWADFTEDEVLEEYMEGNMVPLGTLEPRLAAEHAAKRRPVDEVAVTEAQEALKSRLDTEEAWAASLWSPEHDCLTGGPAVCGSLAGAGVGEQTSHTSDAGTQLPQAPCEEAVALTASSEELRQGASAQPPRGAAGKSVAGAMAADFAAAARCVAAGWPALMAPGGCPQAGCYDWAMPDLHDSHSWWPQGACWAPDSLDQPQGAHVDLGRLYSMRMHPFVPKAVNFAEEYAQSAPEEVTTLMIRNIPNTCTRKMLMSELDALGFEGTYDFLYLPIDSGTALSIGYAFVNFEAPATAAHFEQAMRGHRFRQGWGCRSRAAEVAPAHVQGAERNLQRLRCTAVLSSLPQAQRPWFKQRPPDAEAAATGREPEAEAAQGQGQPRPRTAPAAARRRSRQAALHWATCGHMPQSGALASAAAEATAAACPTGAAVQRWPQACADSNQFELGAAEKALLGIAHGHVLPNHLDCLLILGCPDLGIKPLTPFGTMQEKLDGNEVQDAPSVLPAAEDPPPEQETWLKPQPRAQSQAQLQQPPQPQAGAGGTALFASEEQQQQHQAAAADGRPQRQAADGSSRAAGAPCLEAPPADASAFQRHRQQGRPTGRWVPKAEANPQASSLADAALAALALRRAGPTASSSPWPAAPAPAAPAAAATAATAAAVPPDSKAQSRAQLLKYRFLARQSTQKRLPGSLFASP